MADSSCGKHARRTVSQPIRRNDRLLSPQREHGKPPFRPGAQAIGLANPDVILLMEVDSRWIQDLESLGRIPEPPGGTAARQFRHRHFSRLPLDEGRVAELSGTVSPCLRPSRPPGFTSPDHPLPPGTREDAAERNRQLGALAEWAAAPCKLR